MVQKKDDFSEIHMPEDMAHQPQLPGFRNPILAKLLDVYMRFERFIWDFIGLIMLVVSLVTFLAIIGFTSGAWITPWAGFWKRWLGWGSGFVVLGFAIVGLLLFDNRKEEFTAKVWWRIIALEVMAVSIVSLLAVFGGTSLERAELGRDGGLVGWGISELLSMAFGSLPSGVSLGLRVLILLLFTVIGGIYGARLFAPIIKWMQGIYRRIISEESDELEQMYKPIITPPIKEQAKRNNRTVSPEFQKKFKVDNSKDSGSMEVRPREENLPHLELLLQDKNIKPNERHINQTAGLIEQTLAEFGIPSKVIGFQVGPTITQFAVEPGYINKGSEEDEAKFKVRVSQISSLQRDLALALSAKRLRIQAPVPGRSYVGIEVPNEQAAVVRMRSILETKVFYDLNSTLAVAMGRDVSGFPVVADLSRMPHLLIAGTTGSGKSICIAALTIGLVMNNSPRDLRLVMIDPKMVEMVRFNGLPHLFGKVETELNRSAGVLRWVVVEMERRYKLLELLKARDIENYNKKATRRKEQEHLPRIVVMIDELADLMMNSAEQTESTIVRLAQMARAVGIHLVVATQRPSTDVVTGLIKANFPARLSFAVASSIDSRVILDMPGAESLLGHGDMLFLPPETGVPIRAQGVMITDKEVERVIDFWSNEWQGEEENSPWDVMIEENAVLADRDELVERAITLISETGKASASMMQRRLRIGYPRAARLIDELEDLGVIGPSKGGGRAREVLISSDNEDDIIE